MSVHAISRLYLLGLPGSGKTTVGRQVATLLGWAFVDTDKLVEDQTGLSVADVFAKAGESRFRALEAEALRATAQRERVVIATGGGVVADPANRALMAATGWRVWLAVGPDRALARLKDEQAQSEPLSAVRPLLTGGDAPLAMARLFGERSAFYAEADTTVATDELTADAAASSVVAQLAARGMLAAGEAPPTVRRVAAGSQASYDAVVAWGGLATLGDRLRDLGLPARLHVASDETVGALYAPAVLAALRAAGFDPALWTMPAGEANKDRHQLDALHDWLAERRAERREAVVALGGGVVGDLAGFAAAIYLRGVPVVQVPTTLLAQVDASIGGKVGIDHPLGKNLLGAFHQPSLVLADPAVLLTLSARLYREGMAEIVKHGVALDTTYFAALEHDHAALMARTPAVLTRAIAGSVAIKAAVVEGDAHEREQGGRLLLNFGHTIGHALEQVTGYGAWLHGEAIAVGMVVAARIGLRLRLTPPEAVQRLEALLAACELPVRLPAVPAQRLLHAAQWDKKVRGGQVHWVLLNALGRAAVVSDVPDAVIRAVLIELGATAGPAEPAELAVQRTEE